MNRFPARVAVRRRASVPGDERAGHFVRHGSGSGFSRDRGPRFVLSTLNSLLSTPFHPRLRAAPADRRGRLREVWLARSTATGALRAVKFVRRDTFTDARPFEREFAGLLKFEAVSRAHPSQLALFHVGRAPDDSHFFYVMELADPAQPVGSNQCSVISPQSPRRCVPR